MQLLGLILHLTLRSEPPLEEHPEISAIKSSDKPHRFNIRMDIFHTPTKLL